MPAIQEVIADAEKVFSDKEVAPNLTEIVQSPSGSLNREAASVTHSDERKAEQTERKPSVNRKESVLEALRKHQKDLQAKKDTPEKAPTTQRKKGETAL
jgi:hypothetical protein